MKFCLPPFRAAMRSRVGAAVIWLMAISLAGVPTLTYAQEPAADALKTNTGDTPTFKSEVYVVNALATVRDKHGQIVNNLTKDDFVLQVDGKPTAIKYFARESDLPLTLGLLVDTSLSQRRVLEEERTASYQFLKRSDARRSRRGLRHPIRFRNGSVAGPDELASETGGRARPGACGRQPDEDAGSPGGGRSGGGGGYPSGGGGGYPSAHHRGGTMLYDAVFLASDELMRKQKGRKALILLTDGVDQGSKVSLDRAIETARGADTMVYSILFSDPSGLLEVGDTLAADIREAWEDMAAGVDPWAAGRRPGGRIKGILPAAGSGHADGKKVLQRMSKETGGRFFEVSKKGVGRGHL